MEDGLYLPNYRDPLKSLVDNASEKSEAFSTKDFDGQRYGLVFQGAILLKDQLLHFDHI